MSANSGWGACISDIPIGSGGLSVANQIYDRFAVAGKPLNPGDIAIVDASKTHDYQASSYQLLSLSIALIFVTIARMVR